MRMLIPSASLAVAAISLLSSPALSQTLTCGRTTQPPVIDAQPTDDCWQDAMMATDFSVLGSGGAERAFRQTTVRAAWDDSALYLHAICLEPDPASITANVTDRDGETWMEDCMEVFLQPDTAKPRYFHFISNARGVLYDEMNEAAGFDAEVEIRAEIGESAWQVEMAIPWGELGPNAPQPGDEWGFNVGRVHRPQEPMEWTTWARLEKGVVKYGLPKLFGRLAFAAEPKPGRVSDLDLPEGLVANPDFSELRGERPDKWGLSGHSSFSEIAPMSRHYGIRNDGDYGIASQALNVPIKAGDIFTVYAVLRASKDATVGIAVVQEMDDGRPDDLYPFWNISASAHFKQYTGRIVVDKDAKRFKSVNLYRSNRKGWVEYTYVQVLPGLHGVRGITEAERCTREDERGIGEPWPTPAVRAFKPLPGGPLKTLIFIGEFQRDAVELAQRLDMDYDLVYCPTYRRSGKVDSVVAFGANKVLRKLSRHEYDLIILAGRPSEETVVRDILESVRGSAGLLVVEPLSGGPAAKPEVFQRLLDELPEDALPPERLAEVLGALDPDALTQTSNAQEILKSLAVRELDEGRIARLTWSAKVPGLTPFAPGVCEYWEYRWAALCKAALWAARRQPSSRISSAVCGDTLTIRIASPEADPLELTVQWDGRLDMVGEDRTITGPFQQGTAQTVVAVNQMIRRTRGPNVARVLLSDKEGHALDVAACLIPTPASQVEILEVVAPNEVHPGDEIPVGITYHSRAGNAATLKAELSDAFDRVVSRSALPVNDPGEHEAALKLVARSPMSVYHRIVVTVADEQGALIDRAERDLFVPEANADHLSDFHLGVGYAAMHVRCPEYLQDHLTRFLRAQGVQAVTVNEYMIQRGMVAFGGMVSGGMRQGGPEHARKACFSDAQQIKALAERTVQGVGKKRLWGFFGYNMEDEVHLHQQGSVEVCNSEHCARAFRNWARQTYEKIEVANAEWSTSYKSFDEIPVPLLADMKGAANPARWVDFRLFMERVWAGAYAAAHEAVREAFPEVSMSFTNPYKYNSLSGVDFSLWTPHEEVLLRYFHRHVVDRNRSWSRAPMVSWFGYRRTAEQSGHFVWWFALNGGVIPIWWNPVEPWAYAGKEGFTPWYLCGPLWRPTGRSEAVTRAAEDLQAGIGKLLRVGDPAPAEVAILHSQPSMHVLYAEAAIELGRPTQTGYSRYRASDDAIAAALKRHAFAYRYVLPEQLTGEHLDGVRLLALPSCVALSEESIAALREFVERGGKLLADAMPGTHDAHGKPRGASPVADLFATDSAVCLGPYGDAETAEPLDEAIARLGVRPQTAWHTSEGALPAHTELYRFRLGAGEYLGIVRETTEEAEAEGPITIKLPETRYVYDCRERQLLGKLDELELDVPAGGARFLALLPYAPEGVEAEASVNGDTLRIAASVTGAAKPTDHVFRIEVTPPGAEAPAFWYSSNVLAKEGRADVTIPLALNDPRGFWRIKVRDVATGLTTDTQAGVET